MLRHPDLPDFAVRQFPESAPLIMTSFKFEKSKIFCFLLSVKTAIVTMALTIKTRRCEQEHSKFKFKEEGMSNKMKDLQCRKQ